MKFGLGRQKERGFKLVPGSFPLALDGLLANDAGGSPWNRGKALGANGFTAAQADSEGARIHTAERGLNFAQADGVQLQVVDGVVAIVRVLDAVQGIRAGLDRHGPTLACVGFGTTPASSEIEDGSS